MTQEDQERERDAAVKLLDVHVHALSEHFENVQIFCSRVTDSGDITFGIQRGAGNVYAREGHVREWLLEHNEQARENARPKEDSL